MVTPELLVAAEHFVREALSGADGSHDWWHVSRVRANALLLAQREGLTTEDQHLAELAALLHDVEDYKYSGSEKANAIAVKAFLDKHQVAEQLAQRTLDIIASVGFKDELGSPGTAPKLSPVAAVVQDADRLDAIGAIGIARCFTFGGRFNRQLYDPSVPPRFGLTKEQYVADAAQATTINHFYEKLLKLKGLMKTQAGRQQADGRHEFMVQFLAQFDREQMGQA